MGEPLVVAGAREDTLGLRVLGRTIDGENIQLSVVFSGDVIRPDRIATAKGETIVINIPAKVRAP